MSFVRISAIPDLSAIVENGLPTSPASAAAGGAHETAELTLGDLQVHPIQDREVLVGRGKRSPPRDIRILDEIPVTPEPMERARRSHTNITQRASVAFSAGAAPEASPSVIMEEVWWRRVDSNHRHRAYETPALPAELRRHGKGQPKGRTQDNSCGAAGIIGERCGRVKTCLPPLAFRPCLSPPCQRTGSPGRWARNGAPHEGRFQGEPPDRRWISYRSRSKSLGS